MTMKPDYIEKNFHTKVVTLLDRIGDDLGYYFKPEIFKVIFNDPIEEHGVDTTGLAQYRMYFSEIPQTNAETQTGAVSIYAEFLLKLESVANRYKLPLIFAEDVMTVGCEDLGVLHKALDILDKELGTRPRSDVASRSIEILGSSGNQNRKT